MKPTEEQIRERAYALWYQRGCPGDDTGSIDWAEAERQLNEESQKPSEPATDIRDARSLRRKLAEWGLTGTEHEKEHGDE